MTMQKMLKRVYHNMDGSEVAMEYSRRHGINSLAVLTVYDDDTAEKVACHLAPQIENKTVIEIGGGIGLLAFHLGVYAKHVWCIEANPAWAWTFVGCLYASKPKNVSYLFGAAEEFIGRLHGDVAIFCTHSDTTGMKRIGEQFAPTVIDVYGDIIRADPSRFDSLAWQLRALT